jgi:hypothetical protein
MSQARLAQLLFIPNLMKKCYIIDIFFARDLVPALAKPIFFARDLVPALALINPI